MMQGKGSVRFSDLFADTVRAFGVVDSWAIYSRKGMSAREFRFWCVSCVNRGLI